MMKFNWTIDIGDVIAIMALVISLASSGISAWWLFFRNLDIKIMLEKKIQVLQEKQTNAFTKEPIDLCGFNILAVITASGSSSKWATVKFDKAKVVLPDGEKVGFECRSYLEELGSGQKNKTRAIPIAIKGGDSITITSGYQASNLQWTPGKYSVVIEYSVNRGKESKFQLKELEFTLDENISKKLSDPRGYFTIDIH